MPATRPLMTYYARVNGSILHIHPWQNEGERSVNNDLLGIMVTLERRCVAEIHNQRNGWVHMQQRMPYAPCPISKLSINRVSMMIGLGSQVIDQRLGHFNAY
jgi:hypothetical protein